MSAVHPHLRRPFIALVVLSLLSALAWTHPVPVKAAEESATIEQLTQELNYRIAAKTAMENRVTTLLQAVGFSTQTVSALSAKLYPIAPVTQELAALQDISATEARRLAQQSTATSIPAEIIAQPGPVNGEAPVVALAAAPTAGDVPFTSGPPAHPATTSPISNDWITTFAAPSPTDTAVPAVAAEWVSASGMYLDDEAGPALPPMEYDDQLRRSFGSPAFSTQLNVSAVFTQLGFLVCPVAGDVRFINDFGFPRSHGRKHRGNDMFADRNTPLVAVAAGTIIRADFEDNYVIGTGRGDLGGITLWLRDDVGNKYYYAHLESIAPGIVTGVRVDQGQIIGYLGNSGNAATTSPHLHFQIHPGGGEPTNPYPINRVACMGDPLPVTITDFPDPTSAATTTTTSPTPTTTTTPPSAAPTTTVPPAAPTTTTTPPAVTTTTTAPPATTTTTTTTTVAPTTTTAPPESSNSTDG